MSKLKVLITHAVPVNNGDAALVIALYQQLVNKGFDVQIATYYYSIVKKKYPKLPVIRELADYYLLRKLPFLKPLFMYLNFMINKEYRNNDLFIASPGGYVNSYYQLRHALLPLKLAHKNGKRTTIYSQSIGPFNREDAKLFVHASKYIDLVLARDRFSVNTLQNIGYNGEYIFTKDAAFLLKGKRSTTRKKNKIAVSVREWEFDDRNMDNYIAMIAAVCAHSISLGYDIELVSTCQGVPGYKDDSKTAVLVEQILRNKYKLIDGISVNTSYYTLDELMEKIVEYDYVIGTRLHMCLLSWLCHVPALNIGYEIKGKESYKYLGIPQYSIDFNENINDATITLTNFFSEMDTIKEKVFNRVDSIQQEVDDDFGEFIDKLKLLD